MKLSELWYETNNTMAELEELLIKYYGKDELEFILDNLRVFIVYDRFLYRRRLIDRQNLEIIKEFIENLKRRME